MPVLHSTRVVPARAARVAHRLLVALLVLACDARGSADDARAGRARAADTTGRAANAATVMAASPAPSAIVDDFGDTLPAATPARRIVSLNPTTTELLFALGAGARLVGRSRWDEWPAAAAAVPAVGDGIRPNVEAVLATRPDLVVLYASEDNRAAAGRLRAAGIATLALRIDRIAEFRRAAALLGAATGTTTAARTLADTVDATLARVRRLTSGRARPTVFWRVWEAPLMTVGGGSYVTELLDIAGARNAFADLPAIAPQVSFEEVLRRQPDVVLSSGRDTAGMRADPRWSGVRAVRAGRFALVEADLLARPSVRLGEAAVALAAALHPAIAGPLRAPR